MTTLQDYLLELHDAAGRPSSRTIASGTGGALSHAAVNDALRGNRASSWKTISLVVAQLGGDTHRAYSLWKDHDAGLGGDDLGMERHETAVLVLVSSEGVDGFDARNVALGVLERALAGQGTAAGRNITVEVKGRSRTITIQEVRALHTAMTRPSAAGND